MAVRRRAVHRGSCARSRLHSTIATADNVSASDPGPFSLRSRAASLELRNFLVSPEKTCYHPAATQVGCESARDRGITTGDAFIARQGAFSNERRTSHLCRRMCFGGRRSILRLLQLWRPRTDQTGIYCWLRLLKARTLDSSCRPDSDRLHIVRDEDHRQCARRRPRLFGGWRRRQRAAFRSAGIDIEAALGTVVG